MNTNEQQIFFKLLQATINVSANPRVIDEPSFDIWWATLEGYSLEAVRAALGAHIKLNKFAPTPTDVIDIIMSNSGIPSPEEAWNSVPKSDSEGGWVTDQMMAGLAACQDSINRNDMVGARKAFLEKYSQLLAQVKLLGIHPVFFYSAASIGSDDARLDVKKAATQIAHTKGWVTDHVKDKVLAITHKPQYTLEDLSKASAVSDEKWRKNIKALKKAVNL